MEIVIDIDENVFTRLFDNGKEDYEIVNDDLFAIAKSIRNGKPLPKGHGRLIDADEEIKNYCNKVCGHTLEECGYGFYCPLVQWMISAQVVIEADKEDS